MAVTTVRLPPEIEKSLADTAVQLKRSKGWIINQALSEYSASRQPRLIDGIMLTKFDTIDDKVGAALSLVYTTGKPIVFVGVGQTSTDIRNLNVDHCVRALLKG